MQSSFRSFPAEMPLYGTRRVSISLDALIVAKISKSQSAYNVGSKHPQILCFVTS